MRRTLWRLRALAEGGRVSPTGPRMLLDEAHHHPDSAGERSPQALSAC